MLNCVYNFGALLHSGNIWLFTFAFKKFPWFYPVTFGETTMNIFALGEALIAFLTMLAFKNDVKSRVSILDHNSLNIFAASIVDRNE